MVSGVLSKQVYIKSVPKQQQWKLRLCPLRQTATQCQTQAAKGRSRGMSTLGENSVSGRGRGDLSRGPGTFSAGGCIPKETIGGLHTAISPEPASSILCSVTIGQFPNGP